MDAHIATALKRRLTPRFPIEMAAAALAALGLSVVAGDLGREARPTSSKLEFRVAEQQPQGQAVQSTQADEAATADFIEDIALAHLATPRPDDAFADGATPASPASRTATLRGRPKLGVMKVAAVMPPPRPAERSLVEASAHARLIAATEGKPRNFHTPAAPDTNVKSPTFPANLDIVDGVGSIGRRIGALFARS